MEEERNDAIKNKKKRKGKEIEDIRRETDSELHLVASTRNKQDDIAWNVILPKTLEELLLKWKSVKEENCYTIVMFAWKLYDITLSVLKDGCEFNEMKENDIKKGLSRWITIVEKFRVCNRNQLSKYSVTDTFEKFSIDTLYFLCQCNLLMILETCFPEEIQKRLPREKDYRKLTEKRVLMFKYTEHNVTNFNEGEVMISLLKLSQVWNEICPEKAIERFIDGIIIRIARMLVNLEDTFTEDGTLTKKIPDKAFFSDVASMTSHMKTCFYISRDDDIKKDTLSMVGKVVCEGYNVEKVYGIISEGFLNDIKFWNQETYGKSIKKIVYNINMRPGEEQRFARQNGGVYTREATDVLELYRTDIQWDNIYERMLKAIDNIPKTLPKQNAPYYDKDRDRGFISSIKNPTLLKLFDMLCNMESNLGWIENCVVLEKDVSYHYKKLTTIKYPIVIQMAGEFNVLFNKYLYKTKDVEIALSVWIIIAIKLLDAKLFISGATYNLEFLRIRLGPARASNSNSVKKSEQEIMDEMVERCEKSVESMEINID